MTFQLIATQKEIGKLYENAENDKVYFSQLAEEWEIKKFNFAVDGIGIVNDKVSVIYTIVYFSSSKNAEMMKDRIEMKSGYIVDVKVDHILHKITVAVN